MAQAMGAELHPGSVHVKTSVVNVTRTGDGCEITSTNDSTIECKKAILAGVGQNTIAAGMTRRSLTRARSFFAHHIAQFT